MRSASAVLSVARAVLLFAALQPALATAGNDSSWHLGPRVGLAPGTGVFGIEGQQEHLGFAVGVIPPCLYGCKSIMTGALKYYFNETGDSWAIGMFTWLWGDEDVADGLRSLAGAEIQHHWRWTGGRDPGWDLAVGLAIGAHQGKDIRFTNPLPSLSLGYSF